MVHGAHDTDEELDIDKNKWKAEREAFHRRVDLFIARMHLVQGDRRFSQWKGSVVDSVVGVFLTQNVTDRLSSSAFMSLAAKYPLQSQIHREEIHQKSKDGTEHQGSIEELTSLNLFNATRKKFEAREKGKNSYDTTSRIGEDYTNMKTEAKRLHTKDRTKNFDWDSLRKQACAIGKPEGSSNRMDSLDWEAVRHADVSELSQTIRDRGMNTVLAGRIKEFLDRLVRDHGSINLEWLRDISPDDTKNYLLSFYGLGLKSVECVRLLTLQQLAFPVDTNVCRICVRLGWVPLQPLPESLQLHLLEVYPPLESVQKYLWPRLCRLDQRTLYELHYQMITFGKVFCTKQKPNCNACPMRGECKHFASAFASAKLALPAPEKKNVAGLVIPSEIYHSTLSSVSKIEELDERIINSQDSAAKGSTLTQLEMNNHVQGNICVNCQPIIDEPSTPRSECLEPVEIDFEDTFREDPHEIPTINLNLEEFTMNLQYSIRENNKEGDRLNALVALTPEIASIPMPKLKSVSRLRTEHLVYELPDTHPLLEGMDQREQDDPSPYLLAIWTPAETTETTASPKVWRGSQETSKPCYSGGYVGSDDIHETQLQTVKGTLLVPCRTAMRGSFPLNGTYFQVNEVFADHESSHKPIDVPREWLYNLPRRTVFFGTSISTIFRGLTTEKIQLCFWRGFVCVRGFDRVSRDPKPLLGRLHLAPSHKQTF